LLLVALLLVGVVFGIVVFNVSLRGLGLGAALGTFFGAGKVRRPLPGPWRQRYRHQLATSAKLSRQLVNIHMHVFILL
jgi:hypothetical protein